VKYYPAFLNLRNKKVIVVGGGDVAERKVHLLVKAGALVTVISPTVTKNLQNLKEKGAIKHIRRNYKKGDLRNAFVVIAATSSTVTNLKIAQDAPRLVNVVDIPSEGNYIVPSVVERGPLTIAISTQGASPAISKAIRKELERLYNADFVRYLRFVEKIRAEAITKLKDKKKKEKFLKSLASEEMLNALRDKGYNQTSKKILDSFNRLKSKLY
jgi:precorrin-2 dehydrogenase/sirohydrochlorin ferrochelatase